MNEQLQYALSELASKLGTSVEHLWPVLVAKEKFDAAMWVFGGGIVALIFLILFVFFVYVVTKKKWDSDLITLAGICLALSVIFGVLSVSSIGNYYYPESSTIRSILNGS